MQWNVSYLNTLVLNTDCKYECTIIMNPSQARIILLKKANLFTYIRVYHLIFVYIPRLMYNYIVLSPYKNSPLDYKLCVCPAFSFPVRILYFYAKGLFWVHTCEIRPIRSPWGVGGVARTKRVAQN